jgi:hypothetical protein
MANTSLIGLCLEGNNIGDEGTVPTAEARYHSTQLCID